MNANRIFYLTFFSAGRSILNLQSKEVRAAGLLSAREKGVDILYDYLCDTGQVKRSKKSVDKLLITSKYRIIVTPLD